MKTKNPRKLELKASVSFPGNLLPWSFKTTEESISSVTVDTNGDLSPDTRLPGTSNFSAGMSPDLSKVLGGGIGACQCPQPCHSSSGEVHCYWPSNCYLVPCDE